MKVLILTSSYPTAPERGEGAFIRDLALSLIPDQEPVVLAPHYRGALVREENPGVTVYRFPYMIPFSAEGLAYGAGIPFNIRKNPLLAVEIVPFLLAGFLWTAHVLRRESCGVIHSQWLVPQGLIGAIVRTVQKTPHVATVHGSDLSLVCRYPRLLGGLCRFILRHSDAVTVNSRFNRDRLLAVAPAAQDKISVIPMGVPPGHPGVPGKERPGHPGSDPVILSVGRLIRWKGFSFLIAAMPSVIERYPDARLVIAGDGPDRLLLGEQVRELGLERHVRFTGHLPRTDLDDLFRSATVFVLPSITLGTDTEGLGVVLLEAMAAGCPVVATNTGGIPDIITDGETGFLVPEQDPRALAGAIVRLLSDGKLRDTIGMNGLIRAAEKFSWKVVSARFSEVYSAATGRSRS